MIECIILATPAWPCSSYIDTLQHTTIFFWRLRSEYSLPLIPTHRCQIHPLLRLFSHSRTPKFGHPWPQTFDTPKSSAWRQAMILCAHPRLKPCRDLAHPQPIDALPVPNHRYRTLDEPWYYVLFFSDAWPNFSKPSTRCRSITLEIFAAFCAKLPPILPKTIKSYT